MPVYYLTCHRCPPCLRSEFNLCQNGLSEWKIKPEVAPHFRSGFATHYYVFPGQYFYKVPDEVDDATVAGANCGLAQMLFVIDQVGIEPGETFVVQGAGGLGLYAAAVAHERGARVIAIDGVPERLELARTFGAAETISLADHPDSADRVARVQDLTGGIGADMVLEVTGVPAPSWRPSTWPGSTAGSPRSATSTPRRRVTMTPGIVTRKSVHIHGVLRYHPWYLHKAVEFLSRRHHLHPFEAFSDRSYPLSEVTDALKAGESRSVARVAIVP